MHAFVSTRPALNGRSRALVLSVAAHILFFASIITARVSTASEGGALAQAKIATERLRFIVVAPAPPEPIHSAAPTTRSRAQKVAKPIPSLSDLKFHIPDVPNAVDGISVPLPPDLDFTSKITDSLDFGPTKSSPIIGDGSGLLGGMGAAPSDGIYTVDMVERVVAPYPGNPKPIYPSSLLSAGVEGTFIVHFVVNADGRVDEKSMEFPPTAHRLFIDAVRRALKRSKYRPAEVAGQPVKQLVEQQFTFRIDRER